MWFQLINENHGLKKGIQEVERINADKDQQLIVLQRKTQADAVELMTLRKACQLQKEEMAEMEYRAQSVTGEINEARDKCKEQMAAQEAAFEAEKTAINNRLHDVLSNEANLLNRINSLESQESYARAEVDKVLFREREMAETLQQLQYKVECLGRDLDNANDVNYIFVHIFTTFLSIIF